MAHIYRTVKGRKIEKFLAEMSGVQDELDNRAFDASVRARAALLQHRQEGHAEIEVDRGRVDRYVTLSDERGLKAAMSIEYGRAGYIGDDGRVHGAMAGLFILHDAFNLQRKAQRAPKRRRSRRKRR
jgi:hypothetical protein